MSDTIYINLEMLGGHASDKGTLNDYGHYIDIDNCKFIFKFGGKEYSIGGSEAILDVNVVYNNNQFTVNENIELNGKYASLRFKAPNELVLTDNPTLIINNTIYTIESGYFNNCDIVICNIDLESRKAFFRNVDREGVIILTGVSTYSDDSSITIEWDNVTDNNIKGYYITYGTHIPSSLNDGTTIKIDNKLINSYTINNLENDTEYFIMITPYTKRNVFITDKYVSESPFAGVKIKDIPLGSIVKSKDETHSFKLIDINHYSKGEVTLFEKGTTEIDYNIEAGSSYPDTPMYLSAQEYINTLIKLDINPILVPIDYIDSRGNFNVTNEKVYFPSVNELNGIYPLNNGKEISFPFKILSDNFKRSNLSSENLRKTLFNFGSTRDRVSTSSSNYRYYWINGGAINEFPSKPYELFIFNIDGNTRLIEHDGYYCMK